VVEMLIVPIEADNLHWSRHETLGAADVKETFFKNWFREDDCYGMQEDYETPGTFLLTKRSEIISIWKSSSA
jgi:hypothetical protein